MKLIDTFFNSLIDDWKKAWKLFSVQFSVIIASVLTYSMTYPDQYNQMVNTIVPDHLRAPLGILIGLGGVYLRLKKQGA